MNASGWAGIGLVRNCDWPAKSELSYTFFGALSIDERLTPYLARHHTFQSPHQVPAPAAGHLRILVNRAAKACAEKVHRRINSLPLNVIPQDPF